MPSFGASEREAIVSTMLGMVLRRRTRAAGEKDGGLYRYRPAGHRLATKPPIPIFLLAISKREYEEAMASTIFFVTFPRERAMSRPAATRSFDEFKTVAMRCQPVLRGVFQIREWGYKCNAILHYKFLSGVKYNGRPSFDWT